jgi:apolipoprotein N-acyltransferase
MPANEKEERDGAGRIDARSRGGGISTWLRVILPGVVTALLVTISAPGSAHGRAQALLSWIALLPLLAALPALTPRRAALAGLVAGTATYLGWAAWLPGLMARFSGWPPVAAVLAAILLAVAHGAGWALWSFVVRRTCPPLHLALVAPASFVVMERWFPSVFPWSLGLAHYQFRDLAQLAELGGPCVLSFLEISVAAVLAQAWLAWRVGHRLAWRGPAILVVVLAAALAFGHVRRTSVEVLRGQAPRVRIAAVQAGVVFTGWQAQTAPDLLDRYRQATAEIEREAGRFDLLIWPEKASPTLRKDAVHDYPPGHARRLRVGFASPLLFGAEAIAPGTRDLWNAAALLDAEGHLRVAYAKMHLILWSEWLPRWGVRLFGRRYQPGTSLAPIAIPLDGRPGAQAMQAGVFICFESAFPGHVRALVASGAEVLINLSDDSWFGDSAEPEQHLAHIVFRAIESRRDVVRSTGSGISALISASGEVEKRLPVSHSGATVAVLAAEPRLLRARGIYARLGDAFALACAMLTAAAMLVARGRNSGRGT